MQDKYLICAYYHLCNVKNPENLVKDHKTFFKGRDIKGRIYISKEGINGQMSGSKEDSKAYMDWLAQQPGFQKVIFKCDPSCENIFFKLTVKVREQLVAFDHPVDLSKRGQHLSPQEWKDRLEKSDDYTLVDVRNDYETKVGHFQGALLPECKTFREFVSYTDQKLIQEKKIDKAKPILMYCTGGIRCEYYSAHLKEKGFENVYQLDGGVINYGHQFGSQHFEGSLFVFDDRLVTKLSEKSHTIAECEYCSCKADTYYNCANMDCNFLFTCCQACLKEHLGCCSDDCTQAKRRRPFNHVSNKPFRKWYYYLPESQAS